MRHALKQAERTACTSASVMGGGSGEPYNGWGVSWTEVRLRPVRAPGRAGCDHGVRSRGASHDGSGGGSGCDLDAINVTCSLPRAAERQRLARPASAVITMALAKQGTARAIRSSAVPTGPAKHTWLG